MLLRDMFSVGGHGRVHERKTTEITQRQEIIFLLICAGFVLLSFLKRQKPEKKPNSYSLFDNQPIKLVASAINNSCITAERPGS